MTTNKHKLFPLRLYKYTPIFLSGYVFLFVLISVFLPLAIEAADASLSIFPQTGSFTAGNTFEVSVFINTGGNNNQGF